MTFAKAPRVHGAQCGVITAAAFGNIVKQRREIEHFDAVELGNQFTTQRELVGKSRHNKAAHVAQHFENMLIDGIHMKQIVLHLAYDAAKCRNVTAQQPILIHASQHIRDAQWRAQDISKLRTMQPIAAKLRTHVIFSTPQCS